MKIKPVECIPAPGYPDKYAEESRQALAAAQPRRWIAAPLAAGLAATVAIGLSGCGESIVDYTTLGEPTMVPTETSTATYTTTQRATQKPTEKSTAATRPTLALGETRPIAANTRIPLFEYGEGTGSIGCVSIAAPVFLSEEEAFAILQTAFAEAGLDLRPDGKTIRPATLPVTDLYPRYDDTEKAMKSKRGSLTTDGALDQLPVEFVSTQDVQAWHADTGMWSSVTLYPVKQSAKVLAENNPGLVVFYDPMGSADYEVLWNMQQKKGESDEAYGARWDAARIKLEQEARAQSEQLLRKQAEAFMQWLSAEGAR